jgi:GrpB-like predicted nucleotidyltransferase (UPF0157 family)/GNAT superfamily N-acetyltransferase
MVAWLLSMDTWEIYEQKGDLPELTAKNDIGWSWCENALVGGKCRTVGDFSVQNTQIALTEQNLQFKDFHITANAYTDINREIEGGDKVELVEYDPLWVKEYADFAKWLTDYLGSDIAIRIEHFGSTAIPGMPTKPIIDIMVEVPSPEEARNRIIKLLNSETWEYWWYDDHMAFIKRKKFMGKRTHHIHIAPRKHELWNRLSFREYLRNHKEDALKYEELKRNLAICYEGDRERYTIAKGDFVQEITVKAMAGRRNTNMVIERASEDDAIEIIKARNKSFYNDFINFGECPGYNIPLEDMKKRIQNAIIYKVSVDGKIIGDISIYMREDEYYWIGCLEIIPEYQNTGIGTKVIKYVEEKHPEAKRWGLETPVQNYVNCCFYEKMGFVKIDDKKQSEKITLRLYEKVIA